MPGIEVHDHIWQVQSLESVRNSSAVAIGGSLARREVGVGDEVRQRVGLDNQGEGGIAMILEHRSDRVDILRLVGRNVSDCELAIRGFGSAVTTREVIDDKPEDIGTRHVRNGSLSPRDVGDGVPRKEFSLVICV